MGRYDTGQVGIAGAAVEQRRHERQNEMDMKYAQQQAELNAMNMKCNAATEESLGDILAQTLSGVHELTSRLHSGADKLTGPYPADNPNGAKIAHTSIRELALRIRDAVNEAHSATTRIERAL